MGDVEKVMAFNSIRGYLSKDLQEVLKNELKLDDDGLAPRIQGLNAEAEFILVINSLESCAHILAFDEGPGVLTNSHSPDLIVVFKESGEKVFIEIKKAKDLIFKIGVNNLQKRIDFANEFGYKLYFAVKTRSIWGLYSSEYLQSKNGKISFKEDHDYSEFEKLFKSKRFIFPKGIKIVSEFSKSFQGIKKIEHLDFGGLISYKFFFNDDLIFEVNNSDEKLIQNVFSTISLQALQSRMTIMDGKSFKIDNDTTLITEELTEQYVIYDYDMLISPITILLNDNHLDFDSTTYYKFIVTEKINHPFTLKILYDTINELIAAGVPIIIEGKKLLKYN